MKVIAIGGVPGSGKSTLVRHLIAQTTLRHKERLAEGVFGHQLPEWNAVVIGAYDDAVEGSNLPFETFPGTDKLSMAAHGPALWYLKKLVDAGEVRTVFFEGDRLFCSGFLSEVARKIHCVLSIVMVEASAETLKERRTQRGTDQSAAFLKGRKTKVMGVVNHPELRCLVVCLPNNTQEEHSRALAMLGKWIDPNQATRKRF